MTGLRPLLFAVLGLLALALLLRRRGGPSWLDLAAAHRWLAPAACLSSATALALLCAIALPASRAYLPTDAWGIALTGLLAGAIAALSTPVAWRVLVKRVTGKAVMHHPFFHARATQIGLLTLLSVVLLSTFPEGPQALADLRAGASAPWLEASLHAGEILLRLIGLMSTTVLLVSAIPTLRWLWALRRPSKVTA